MQKTKRLCLFVAVLLVAIISFMCAPFIGQIAANADTEEEYVPSEGIESADEGISTYGLFTSLSITINGGDGKVWTTVRNDFTLFPSTVIVILQLYAADSYVESYTEMTLMNQDSTMDLDMGKSITVSAPTGGKTRFWMGRMRYKIDSKGWEEDIVGAAKFDADGNFLGVL